MRVLVFALSLSASLALTAHARADDWLVSLESCVPVDGSRPELAAVYPRPGLPAVVAAGDTLVVRVRVPAALTPPPGVQQEKVLSLWAADLLGQGLELGKVDTASAPLSHHHALPALNLRPDGPASLVYRVSFGVPAYAAVGSYDLVLRTPFGTLQLADAVSVIAPGSQPRLALVPQGMTPPLPAVLAALPVDVWVVPSSAATAARTEPLAASALDTSLAALSAQPWLAADVSGMELRVGAKTFVKRACAAPAQALPAASMSLPTVAQLHITRGPTSLAIDNDSAQPLELPLLISARFVAHAQGATLQFQPATDVRARRMFAISARASVPAATHARIELKPVPSAPEYAVTPLQATAGRAFVLTIEGAPPGARVAFDLGPTRTAWAGSKLDTTFSAPGGHHVSALVFGPDGAAHAARGQLWVAPEAPRATCALVQVPRSVDSQFSRTAFEPLLLFAAACLLKRRRRSRFGNRLRP